MHKTAETKASVWFTLTETEISVNGKILIPLTETKKLRETETKKFDTETGKFGYVRFRFRCISRHHAGFL